GKLENVSRHKNRPEFGFFKKDVQDLRPVKKAFARADVIVHLAAYKIPRYGNALQTLMINNRGTQNVLEAAVVSRAKCIVASTSDVYGKNPVLPFHEESDLVMGPSTVRRWSYAVSKLFDEQLCLAYQEEHKIPVVIPRFFGSYGPRYHLSWWGGPIPVFVGAALSGDELDIHGDGNQTRTFQYVSDTVDALMACIESEAADGQVLNIGGETEISIRELAGAVWRLCGNQGPPRVRLVPYSSFSGGRYEDVGRRVPDTQKARRLLGAISRVPLEEGLAMTIAWQRAEQDKRASARRV
ncbi:MAG: GDP-mannose 4,6-dehydratase, partial [Planctomycetota bacterium]|nr:GDP-mannose 4,6-dehydratase [Planctomycetota bacterium]